jgi:hypothetical protein
MTPTFARLTEACSAFAAPLNVRALTHVIWMRGRNVSRRRTVVKRAVPVRLTRDAFL